MSTSVCTVKIGPAMRQFRVPGHWIYCRQRIGSDVRGGIVIPERSREGSQWCDVLAVGEQVGQFRRFHDWPRSVRQMTSQEREKLCLRSFAPGAIHVGDVVLVPKADMNFIQRLRYAEADFLVDEFVIAAALEG